MTMLEKAARALCEAGGMNPTDTIGFRDENGIRSVLRWHAHVPLARGLLLAIREPDEAIASVARARHPYDYDVAEGWTAIVDAILAEQS